MNSIVEKENEKKQLDLLLAQRRLYSRAKNIFVLRTGASIVLAIMGPLVGAASSVVATYVGLFSVFYLVVHHLLQSHERSRKTLAATIQELFDTTVLDLPWNHAVVGPTPAMEAVADALKGAQREEYDSLKDWYAADVAKVDIGLGRVLCQRSNLYWDTGLRGRYMALLAGVLFLVVIGLFAAATYFNVTMTHFVMGMLLPCVPLIETLVSQFLEHRRTVGETRAIIGRLDSVIEALCAKKTVTGLKMLTRTLQDEIFRHRKGCPLVLDWVYWRLRGKQEEEMQFSVKRKVEECLGR